MKMRMTSLVLLALACALSHCATGSEKFSYSGKLAKPDGSAFNTSLPMMMTFRLYTKPTGGYIMWGRTMPVRIAADGSFYVELSDDAGSPVPEAITENLAEALVFGGRVKLREDDVLQNTSIVINGKVYADGDLVSFTHNSRRYTWRVEGLTDRNTLKLVRIRAKYIEKTGEAGTKSDKGVKP